MSAHIFSLSSWPQIWLSIPLFPAFSSPILALQSFIFHVFIFLYSSVAMTAWKHHHRHKLSEDTNPSVCYFLITAASQLLFPRKMQRYYCDFLIFVSFAEAHALVANNLQISALHDKNYLKSSSVLKRTYKTQYQIVPHKKMCSTSWASHLRQANTDPD